MKARPKKEQNGNKAPAPADATLRDFRTMGLKALFVPVDIASVVLLRILFGLIMLWEVSRYFSHDWIGRYWIRTKVHFTYWPFDFLQPLPGNGMYFLFAVLGLLALFITIGFLYRVSIILFFFLFSYTYLLEQTRYLNHFYLVILISFLMMFVPAHGALSVDAKRNPAIRSDTIPAWSLWLLRFTLGLPYFFGGIAKINTDWLQGEPMRSWLAKDTDLPIIGPLFTEEWMIYFISYGGLLLDLLVIPLLLFRRTRKWAFAAAVVFHLMNDQIFRIGIFPWFMLFATSLFFEPSWPRRLWYSLNPRKKRIITVTAAAIVPFEKRTVVLLFLWVGLHIFLPFRHLLFPGNVHWTEEGHKYAWHMKLRSKTALAFFTVRDKNTGAEQLINNRDYLAGWQERKMAAWPNLVWQFSRVIKEDFRKKGKDVAVHADVRASLNGRAYQQLVDPTIDLASTPRRVFARDTWINDLVVPLSQRSREDSDENEE